MKTIFTLIFASLLALAAIAPAQTIKSLGYNTTNGEVVANVGTNVLTFTNAVGFTTNAAAATRTNLGVAPEPIVKWKSTTQSVTNSTNLVDDDTLFFVTEANTKYFVRLYLMVEGAAGTSGTHQFQIASTNATVYGTWRAAGGTFTATQLSTSTSFNLGAASPRNFYISFTALGGAEPGEVKLRWAQGTAATNASSVSEGSALIAEILP